MNRLSGDQNNRLPTPSVPARGRISSELNGRSQIREMPSLLLAAKASCCPSGESP